MNQYKNIRSPKSKEGCRVTDKQRKWLTNCIMTNWGIKGPIRIKNYKLIKRLVLFATK